MKITMKGRYAVIFMVDLAQWYDVAEYINLRTISERQDITVKYLEQIVGILAKNNLILTFRGTAGGYRLSRPPQEYTLGDILRAVEGDLNPVDCSHCDSSSQSKSTCAIYSVWNGLSDVINKYVDSISLADIKDMIDGGTNNYVI